MVRHSIGGKAEEFHYLVACVFRICHNHLGHAEGPLFPSRKALLRRAIGEAEHAREHGPDDAPNSYAPHDPVDIGRTTVAAIHDGPASLLLDPKCLSSSALCQQGRSQRITLQRLGGRDATQLWDDWPVAPPRDRRPDKHLLPHLQPGPGQFIVGAVHSTAVFESPLTKRTFIVQSYRPRYIRGRRETNTAIQPGW